MTNFNLQQWLDDQLEHNVIHEASTFDAFDDVELTGFGFPHYGEFGDSGFSRHDTPPLK